MQNKLLGSIAGFAMFAVIFADRPGFALAKTVTVMVLAGAFLFLPKIHDRFVVYQPLIKLFGFFAAALAIAVGVAPGVFSNGFIAVTGALGLWQVVDLWLHEK